MPRPRKALICQSDTPYYHCVSRCVRRAFLCGQDIQSGRCYEHRRDWLVERIHLLSSLFAIDVFAYAVMSNHYHIVVRIGSSETWSDDEVINRWLCLYQGPLLIQKAVNSAPLTPAERDTIADIVAVWRQRLQDLSWFMKCLNEPIARKANREDHCTGHFWEARFKSQALRTEHALLSCMAYVDLNPVRAGMAETPETSDYTSIQERTCAPNPKLAESLRKALGSIPPKPLMPFSHPKVAKTGTPPIPFTFPDYLELVDWTGRIVRHDKSAHIPHYLPPILSRLNIPARQWLMDSGEFEKIVHRRFGKTA